MRDLHVYLHWPFCVSKCPYCDFSSVSLKNVASLLAEHNEKNGFDEYFGSLLLKELQNHIKKTEFSQINTIFFGGGTPSLMSAKTIDSIISYLAPMCKSDIEISIEANPATFDMKKMHDFKIAGINRVSLGVQSFLDKNLRFLGRIYSSEKAHEAAEIVSGLFENYNFDFMYGYETQNLDDLQNDLQFAINYGVKHISSYQLIFEQGTVFYDQMMSGKIKQISDEHAIEMYDFIANFLQLHNINRYEISNYALCGYESQHNLAYWMYNDYLGIGPGAHSRITTEDKKYAIAQKSNPIDWMKCVVQDISTNETYDQLLKSEEIEEIIIMGLRTKYGIDLLKIAKHFDDNIINAYFSQDKINFLLSCQYITTDCNTLKLTDIGLIKIDSIINFFCDKINPFDFK